MSSSRNDKSTFDPVDFYRFASWLYAKKADNAPTELSRVIIGRAYYAAFLAAREASKLQGSGARIHSEVIAHWLQRNKQLSNRLRDLKVHREQADYKLDSKPGDREAGESLRLCKNILLGLGKIDAQDVQEFNHYLKSL